MENIQKILAMINSINDINKLVIIIGLPGSGKTTLANKLFEQSTLQGCKSSVHDDFIPHIYNGKLINQLKKGIVVFASDPRLCKFENMEKYVEKIKKFVNNINIILIMFPNNPSIAKIQAKKREEFENGKNVNNAIEFYTKLYNPQSYINITSNIIFL
jgi:adenylate kinase family enzyme